MPPLKPLSGTTKTYRALKQLGTTTRPDLAEATGLSLPAVGTIVDTLFEYGLVKLSEPEASGKRGRPAQEVSLCPEQYTVAVIDFSGATCQIGLYDLYGNLVRQEEGYSLIRFLGMTPDQVETYIYDQLSRFGNARSFGVSFPGIVLDGVIQRSWLLGSTTSFDLKASLERRLGATVHLENDVNAAAWGEFRHRKLKGSRSLLYLGFGHGFGAGLVIGGRLHRGAHGASGEVALLPVGVNAYLPEGENVSLPDLDLSSLGSDYAELVLANRRAATMGELTFSMLIRQGMSMADPVSDMVQKVLAGDEQAKAALGFFNRNVALMLASSVASLDPDIIVLQDAWPQTEELFLKPVAEHLGRFLTVNLAVSQLGQNAALFGIAITAAEELEMKLLQKVYQKNGPQ